MDRPVRLLACLSFPLSLARASALGGTFAESSKHYFLAQKCGPRSCVEYIIDEQHTVQLDFPSLSRAKRHVFLRFVWFSFVFFFWIWSDIYS
uniref:Secreted protein n=1 Tax=Anopheles darlingi TaxID=43151 RepID=A0A2M4DEM5_ANODA